MVVNIDESGSQSQAGGVDYVIALRWFDVPDLVDFAILNAYISSNPGSARAIDDIGIFEDSRSRLRETIHRNSDEKSDRCDHFRKFFLATDHVTEMIMKVSFRVHPTTYGFDVKRIKKLKSKDCLMERKVLNEKQFEGRSAIVTGGTRGIGKAIVLELARHGANVAFNFSKSADEADALKKDIESLGAKVYSAQCDVANTSAAAEFVNHVKETFGTVDFLVNNAGITRDQLILRMKEEDWDSVIDTNLKGAWNFSKAAVRPMMRNENGGSILNISSISGVVGMLGQSNYSASKAGMIGLTKSLAKEIASRKITVNALALGLIETDMASEMNDEYREKILAQIPLGRLGTVREVAELACFMLSPSAAYISGQVIQADGGLAM